MSAWRRRWWPSWRRSDRRAHPDVRPRRARLSVDRGAAADELRVQMLAIGSLGEYVARIYQEVKGRPLYVVMNRYGFD